jgi:protein-S-isoprenylcysteine O-methyltransferase Ste14
MPVLALVLIVVWILLVSVVPSVLQQRRTGALPARYHDQPGSAQLWARVVSSVGIAFAVAAPMAELVGLRPVALLDHAPLRLGGVALMVVGVAGTLVSQRAMGASWRPDVDPQARTALVTTGPFRLVRNPVFTATATTAVGLALMVPNVFAAAMLVAFFAAYQIQVRLVEEPYLLRAHGKAYRDYAARTGRFLPWVGHLRVNSQPQDEQPRAEGGAGPIP